MRQQFAKRALLDMRFELSHIVTLNRPVVASWQLGRFLSFPVSRMHVLSGFVQTVHGTCRLLYIEGCEPPVHIWISLHNATPNFMCTRAGLQKDPFSYMTESNEGAE